jgi:hypothetical protein
MKKNRPPKARATKENTSDPDQLSKSQDAEIQKRIDRICCGESILYTWDEVKAYVLRQRLLWFLFLARLNITTH